MAKFISVFSLRRVCVPLRPTRISASIRLYSSSDEFRTGRYAQVTEDVVFKRLMHQENLRNSFLSAVLGEPVSQSEILDASLNPIKEFEQLRKVVNERSIRNLMKEISLNNKIAEVTNSKTKRPLRSLDKFLRQLSLHYQHLLHALPLPERNTELDICCKTKDGLVNIEVQVEPQNFWDIRILSHVCGLFQGQFPRSFKWSSLDKDPEISNKVRRAIGVSIFETAPVHQADVQEFLHWYDAAPWSKEELRRHYRITEQTDKRKRRPGIEFFEFNLQAVSLHNSSLLEQPVALQEWLDFLAKAHYKNPQKIEVLKTPELKEAYHMVEMDSWDEKLRNEYLEQQAKRYNISQYVRGEKEQAKVEGRSEGRAEGRSEGRAEGRAEGKQEERLSTAEALLLMGLSDEEIMQATRLTAEQLDK